jgi:hypothetical protein
MLSFELMKWDWGSRSYGNESRKEFVGPPYLGAPQIDRLLEGCVYVVEGLKDGLA